MKQGVGGGGREKSQFCCGNNRINFNQWENLPLNSDV